MVWWKFSLHSDSSITRKMVVFSALGIVVIFTLLGAFFTHKFLLVNGLRSSSNVTGGQECLPLHSDCVDSTNSGDNVECCLPYICRKFQLQLAEKMGNYETDLNVWKCFRFDDMELPTTTTETTMTTQNTTCPYSSKLEQILEPIREGEEFDATLKFYDDAKTSYLRFASHRGDFKHNYLLTIRELNSEARRYLGITTENVGRNIFPLIVASESSHNGDEGIGGTFTLYLEDGSSQSVSPVSHEYEIRKGVSHIPLGIYGILVPYFNTENASGWRKPLALFGEKINEALEATLIFLKSSTGDFNLYKDNLYILEMSTRYISKWLNSTKSQHGFKESRIITVTQFEEYSQEILPYLDKSVKIAAQLQMDALIPALQRWKGELGEKKWSDVYAVIPTFWPVSGINTRFQALAAVMNPEQAKQQIFMLENGGSVERLRGILGQIIAHRVAAQLIFGTSNRRAREFTFALAGRQDLMSIDAQDAINSLHRT